jgi:sugar lactone lactonase YvrE
VLGYSGDGGPATKAQTNVLAAVAVPPGGDEFYFNDADNLRIRKVDTEGTITTFAGNGEEGYSGDGGPAREASFTEPTGIAFDAEGNLYVADFGAVRKIDRSGTITTVAGTGRFGEHTVADDVPLRARSPGDGGPATEAKITPIDVAPDDKGNLYISDFHTGRVHKVNRKGVIRTVAGSGKASTEGDDGRATAVKLNDPWGIAVDSEGNLFIAEHHGQRIRMVDPDGRMTTIAGNGESGFAGDRGQATELMFQDPGNLLVDDSGLLYIADFFNARVWATRYAEQ